MIRLATLEDIPALVDFAREFAPSFGSASFSENRFRPEIRRLIKAPGAQVLVADHNRAIVGALVGQVGRVWYSDDLYATDLAFVVRPEHSAAYAWLMIKRFIRWAKEVPGVVEITMQVSSGHEHADRIGELYEAFGMKRMGGCYTLEFERKTP